MEITPTDKQIEAHELVLENDIVVFGGAIRGGKSLWGFLELFSLSMEFPNSRWVIIRKTLMDIKRTTLVSWGEFSSMGAGRYVKNFKQDTMTVTFNNGSQIIFMGEDYEKDKELYRFRGLEVNGGLLEEMNELRKATYVKVIERSGSWMHSPGCPSKILGTCNPSKNWVKDEIHDPWKLGTLPEGIAYIPATIHDNPYVSDEYKENLKRLPAYEYKVFVEGDWDLQLRTGNEFWKDFSIDQHVCDVRINLKLPLHVSIDENVLPYIAVSFWQKQDEDICQIHEIPCRDPHNTATKSADKITDYLRMVGFQDVLYVHGDSTSKKSNTIDDEKRNFFEKIIDRLNENAVIAKDRVSRSNPSVSLSREFINLTYAGVTDFKIKISEGCKESINDYQNVKESEDGTMDKKRKKHENGLSYEEYGHFSDIKRYVIVDLMASEFGRFTGAGQMHEYVVGTYRKHR
ncbi:MAG: hypothetical protein GY861_05420 [bacterium]|nr:hypothetical protein [bacterium]